MPEIHIGLGDVARAALDGLKWFVSLPEGGYPSEYPKHPERRGAAAMLDSYLEPSDGEAIVIERTDIAQLERTGGRWSDMGTY